MRQFAPRPANDFAEFIETYYSRCRELAPEIVGQAGKWTFGDLIPGLSDFDTRLFMGNGLTARDWCRIAMAVGRVHLDLAQERPDWARTLEHLPGVNLTVHELFDPAEYYPEFSQWSFYGFSDEKLRTAGAYMARKPWTGAHEIYHWKRIALYFDRYSRTIDPPINLGRFESKYPLHSRYMHYLAPPVHSAVCLMDRKTTPGKLDAFQRARDLFPGAETMDIVLDGIARHYETPEWYEEPRLTQLDERLEDYLRSAIGTVMESRGETLEVPIAPGSVRAFVAGMPNPSILNRFFENIKFARFMKGRLWFYSHDLAWFDSIPLIHIELRRIGRNFLEIPLEIFAEVLLERKMPWDQALEALSDFGFSREEQGICREFRRLADPAISESRFRERASRIVEIYEEFLCVVEKLTLLMRENTEATKSFSDAEAQMAGIAA